LLGLNWLQKDYVEEKALINTHPNIHENISQDSRYQFWVFAVPEYF
jgi:hypothetical protein